MLLNNVSLSIRVRIGSTIRTTYYQPVVDLILTRGLNCSLLPTGLAKFYVKFK